MSKTKAIIIGWDGAPWEYLNPLLESDRLPNFARLLDRSSYGVLESTIPPFTNVAWPAMFTGLSPTHTGVFDGSKAPPGTYEAIPTNLTGFRGTAVWHWLNHVGYRTAVLNVPMTYPAPPVDGVFVSGFDTPRSAQAAAYPRNILDEWAEHGHQYTILDEEITLMSGQNPHQERGDLEPFIQGWIDVSRAQGKHAAWLWQREELDFLFLVFSGSDSVNHRTRYFAQIARVYQALDDALGDIMAVADRDTIICLLSDHGSTPAYRYISLHRALADGQWLSFRSQVATHFWQRLPEPLGALAAGTWSKLPDSPKRVLSFPLLRWDERLAVAYDNINWPDTRVYTRSGMGLLYLNRHDRRPHGAVASHAYADLLAKVRDHFLALCDEAGEPLFAEVLYGDEVYQDADPADDPPDLILRPAKWSDHMITGYPTDPLVRPIPDSREYGAHTPDGVLLLAGPNVRAGHDLGRAALIDVVPTVLALMELPVSQAMDGRILQDACRTRLAVDYMSDELTSRSREEFTPGEADEIMQRLGDLGYL